MQAYDLYGNAITDEEFIKRTDENPGWRTVNKTEINEYQISTVILAYYQEPTYETMIFVLDGHEDVFELANWETRYFTYESALEGHALIVEAIENAYNDPKSLSSGYLEICAQNMITLEAEGYL